MDTFKIFMHLSHFQLHTFRFPEIFAFQRYLHQISRDIFISHFLFTEFIHNHLLLVSHISPTWFEQRYSHISTFHGSHISRRDVLSYSCIFLVHTFLTHTFEQRCSHKVHTFMVHSFIHKLISQGLVHSYQPFSTFVHYMLYLVFIKIHAFLHYSPILHDLVDLYQFYIHS